ncbi:uncharacterized protein LOC107271429 [Cephus cinctus]|uniref:Uncharacterized protein LOC107271429 n=1 Tax=Cephus cinctus TaxID=211228 RepID=A0AAJ7C6F1_CEPCN|nr:uncharacterized protein LOC107271429 [Cephus cinctus]
MATSTLMKFSLVTVIVVLSSYISSTEAVTACPVASGASSTTILNAYNCTVSRCQTALSNCSGPNCSKGNAIIVILQVQLFIAFRNFVGTCTSCSLSLVNIVNAILRLIAIVVTQLLIILQLAVVTLVNVLTAIGVVTVQLVICTNLLTVVVGATALIAVLNLLVNACLNAMLSCI